MLDNIRFAIIKWLAGKSMVVLNARVEIGTTGAIRAMSEQACIIANCIFIERKPSDAGPQTQGGLLFPGDHEI